MPEVPLAVHPLQAPATPTKRALFITALVMVLGVVPGMGIPGGLMMGIADRIIIGYSGSTALRSIGENAWPIAIVVTLLLPLPLLPVLSAVAKWRSAGVGRRLFAVLLALTIWGVFIAWVALELAMRP